MICAFVSKNKDKFSDFEQALIGNHIEIEWIDTGKNLLSLLSRQEAKKPIKLVIIDEDLPGFTGRQLVEQVITQSPMTNCAAISTLSPEEFHEAFEGFGVLMQLPLKPDAQDAKKLVAHLNKILGMIA